MVYDNRKFCFLIIISLLLIQSFVSAGMFPREDPNLPASVRAVKTLDELKPFLADKDELTRQSAVIRFGQLNISSAISIPMLLKIFEKEPRQSWLDARSRVRRQIVYVLGQIRDNQARKALEGLLEQEKHSE